MLLSSFWLFYIAAYRQLLQCFCYYLLLSWVELQSVCA